MPKILLSKLVDWRALFKHYTKESEGLMTKIQVKAMMEEAGIVGVTDPEVLFVTNSIGSFRPSINEIAFVDWAQGLVKLTSKRLI